MLVSGLLGIRSAAKEKRKGDEEIHNLRTTIDSYRDISALLMESEDYDTLNETLVEKQKQYENETAHHRSELATYSATNSGLEMGMESLNQAKAALELGRSQYEAGKRSLQAMEQAIYQAYALFDQYSELINTIRSVIESSELLIDHLCEYQNLLNEIGNRIDILIQDLAELLGLAVKYETTGQMSDQSENEMLNEYNSQLIVTQNDASSIRNTLYDLQDLFTEIQYESYDLIYTVQSMEIPEEAIEMLLNSAGFTDLEDAENLLLSGLTSEQLQILNLLSDHSDGISDESYQIIELLISIQNAAEGLFSDIESDLNEIESWEMDLPYSESVETELESFYGYKAELLAASALIESFDLTSISGEITGLSEETEELNEMMGQFQDGITQLEEMRTAMNEAGEQITAGEETLATGVAQLNAAKEEQKKKAEELDRERKQLDEQEKQLKQLNEQAASQKTLEEREKNLRSELLSRDEIVRRTLYGESLLSASEAWLAVYTEQTDSDYRDRFDASLLMIACAVLAFAGALMSFTPKRSIAMTLFFTLLCQAFAFSVLFLLYRVERRISWSALITILLATAELVFIIPIMLTPQMPFTKTVKRTKQKKRTKQVK